MEKGTFTDPRDGKTYKTVKIGKQTWLAENLNYSVMAAKYYKNDPANGQKYGQLYNWETARRVCPPGWHLPSNAEWQELVNFAGGDKIAGDKLKAVSERNGTDEYGFSALLGGCGYVNGDFVGMYDYSYWWSATGSNVSIPFSNASFAFCWNIGNSAEVSRFSDINNKYYSVRCVMN